jgi:nucleoside diphosphate kinase
MSAVNDFSDQVNLLSSGPVVAMEIRGEGAVSRWLDLLGPEDSSRARQCAPSSVRARFGTGQSNFSILPPY